LLGSVDSVDLRNVPERYRRMIGPTGRRYEPVVTQWIVDLCNADAQFRAAFLNGLSVGAKITWRCDAASLRVESQCRSGMARLDIAIRDQRGGCLAIAEAKIDDAVHGFQLQRYRDLPEVFESTAVIISLAHASAHDKLTTKADLEAVGVRFLAWPKLILSLRANREKFASGEIDQFFSFCHTIQLDQVVRGGRAKGPTLQELKVLKAVEAALPQWDWEPVERPDNISARLRGGKPEWKRIFGPQSHKRLLVYYDRRGKTGPPNIHFQIVLFSANHHPGSREQCSRVMRAWLDCVQRAGLRYYGPKERRRANNEEEKLRTADIEEILSRDFCVTDDLNGQTRVDGVSPENMETCLPRVVESVGFYDRLVASFPPAEI